MLFKALDESTSRVQCPIEDSKHIMLWLSDFSWPLAQKSAHLGESFVFKCLHIFKSWSLKLYVLPFPSTHTACSGLLEFSVITFLSFSPSVLFSFFLFFLICHWILAQEFLSGRGLSLDHHQILELLAHSCQKLFLDFFSLSNIKYLINFCLETHGP